MELSNQELVKSLTSLIDETLEEIETIKKSKFAASEITIEGPGDTKIGDKPTNGTLEAKKKEEKDEEKKDEDKDEDDKEVEKKEEKDEDKKEDKDEDKEDKKEEMKEMKKSLEATESLMKSYVDEKFSTLEERLSKMASAIESLANAPVGRRGVPAGVQALAKSADEEVLTKSNVANKLMDLKKSGTYVDSSDIFTVETCKSYGELKAVADKYGVK